MGRTDVRGSHPRRSGWLVRGAGRFLKPRGYLVLEIGHGERDAVMRLFGEGWGRVECFDDLAEIPRVIVARRK